MPNCRALLTGQQVINSADVTQDLNAKEVLKRAHAGTEESARFTCAIACAVIDLGLQPREPSLGFGFQLAPVTFTALGSAIAVVKKSSSLAASKIPRIIDSLNLQHFFSYTTDVNSEKQLTMHIAHVLPHADASVRSLLPDVAWRGKGVSSAAAKLATGHMQSPIAPQKPQNLAGPQSQATKVPLPLYTSTGADSLHAGEQPRDCTRSAQPGNARVPSLQVQANAMPHCCNPHCFQSMAATLMLTEFRGSHMVAGMSSGLCNSCAISPHIVNPSKW